MYYGCILHNQIPKYVYAHCAVCIFDTFGGVGGISDEQVCFVG